MSSTPARDPGPPHHWPTSPRRPDLLDRLERLHVAVDGWGPLVGWTATALRTAGVGRVTSGLYAGEPDPWATSGRSRRRPIAPGPATPGLSAVIAVSVGTLDPMVAGLWQVSGVIHLPVEQHDGLVQVGPLVIPGASACLTCRARTDPRTVPGPGLPRGLAETGSATPLDPGVGVLTAALAAFMVRRALLGDHALAGISCDVTGDRPDIAHRYWAAHPDCSCLAGRRSTA